MKKSSSSPSTSCQSKICAVCGDKALGKNFGALTCESCKAFFRRNALSNKKFVCPFSSDQKCEITTITRRFCQFHRLEKCFQVGMKKEYIMSEEDKEIKRRKIEQNRIKRKIEKASSDSDTSIESKRNFHTEENTNDNSVSSDVDKAASHSKQVSFNELNAAEIVDKIVSVPENASKEISTLLKTQDDAVQVMTKVLKDTESALKLIGHFINHPADAMLLLSKIMNSPFDSLTVFTQFMRSPTDALQIISKIMSNPNEVLIFMQQLMKFPQDALEIMNKFRRSPPEALQILNKMMNHSSIVNLLPLSHEDSEEADVTNDEMMKSILSVNSTNSANSVREEDEDTCQESKTEDLSTNHSFDPNNNADDDVERSISDITNEIMNDVKMASLTNVTEENPLDSIISEAISLEFGIRPISSIPSNRPGRELNEIEQAKLNELILSHKALYAPVDDDLSNIILEDYKMKNTSCIDPQLLNVINLTAIAIRRLIKMSKKISAFKNLCIEDQIALLKGGCTEMMILRSVMQYHNGIWKIPHSQEDSQMANIKAEVLKLAKGNVYKEHDRFIENFPEELRSDENVILILCAITLFSPNRPRTIHKDVIKLEQNSYYYLLRRYLESVYDGCEARSIFLKLISNINDLHKLNDEVINVYLNVNPSQVEPLLREIFDLKS